MPSRSATLSQRKRALIGSSSIAKSMYKDSYSTGIRKFMAMSYKSTSSTFFKEINNCDPSDWLLHHKEEGQTFEEYWRSSLTGISYNATPLEILKDSNDEKTICILPLGPFPEFGSDVVNAHSNFLLAWLESYCAKFFHTAKIEMLPPVSLEEVACDYRVNEFTGRFQLNASQILDYLRRTKTASKHCLVAVTMIDLFPKPSWNFVFGLASTSRDSMSGVGIFSFCRYDDAFYETWSLCEDVVRRHSDGSLDYSVFSNKRMERQFPKINGKLLLRACKVMTHEVCHMFGLKHCIYMQCLMNGTNHLQESDRRPPQLCPVCLRKLQSVLNFDVLERYKALFKWTSAEHWKESQLAECRIKKESKAPKSATRRLSSSKRKENGQGSSTITRKRRGSIRKSSKLQSTSKDKESHALKAKKTSLSPLSCPPLTEFRDFRLWLREVIEFILSNGKPTFLSYHEEDLQSTESRFDLL